MNIIKINDHRLSNYNILDSAFNVEELLDGKKADIFYSDPPWGQGNLKYWQTLNEKQTGVPARQVNLEDFLNVIFAIVVDHVFHMAFIEYGVRWHDLIKQKASKFGLSDCGTIDTVYGSKKYKMHLHVFHKSGLYGSLSKHYVDSVTGTTGYTTVYKALLPFVIRGNRILDPCCGMGYTARAAIEMGGIFYGNELNSNRLRFTIDRFYYGKQISKSKLLDIVRDWKRQEATK